MTFFDLILILILFGFTWFGFWNGIVQAIGGIVSIVIALFVASRWYEIISVRILPFLGDNMNLARLLGFIGVFIIAKVVMFLLLKIIDKFFSLPILNIFNKLGGAVFGLIEGGLVIGVILYFSTKFPLGETWLVLLQTSIIAPTLIGFAKMLTPLIPDALKEIKSLLIK